MKLRSILAAVFAATFLCSCAPAASSLLSSEPDGSTPSSQGSASTPSLSGSTSRPSVSVEPLPEIDYIRVYCPTNYTKIWAWNDDGNLFKSWPGDTLKDYDEDWKTYDFEGYSSMNLIFSEDGSNKTADLSLSGAGHWFFYGGRWYDVDPIRSGAATEEGDPSPYFNAPYVKQAKTYEDFPLWTAHDDDYWTVLSPYEGSRTDFRDESIYFTITTRFYDGDPSNNDACWDGAVNSSDDPAWRGDFKGLIEKMDYIKALGFTAIWITPIVKNASGYDYHGYHALSFSQVDPRYESEDVAFLDVLKAAHSRDMKIILDIVLNHTGNWGEENLYPMFEKEAGNNAISAMKQKDTALLPANYDKLNGPAQFDARTESLKGDATDAAHIYHHEKSMGYETYIEQTGSMAGDCVDLNTEHPAVANYLVQCYGEFIRMGVDAFRIDTMKHISRLTFNNYYFPALQAFAKKCGAKSFHMFGEVCTRVRGIWNHDIAADSAPFYTWKENQNYAWGDSATNQASTKKHWDDHVSSSNQPTTSNAYLSGLAYHTPDHSRSSGVSVIDFPMHWNFNYAKDAYNVAVNNDQYYNDATYNVVYVDSHDYSPDQGQDYRYNGGTSAWKENMSLMFTFRGVPCVYYGSEIEFQKGKRIDAGTTAPLAETGRAYYGDHLKGEVSASGFGVYTASGTVANTLSATLSKHLRVLNKVRLKVPALRRGQYRSVGELSFVRRYNVNGQDSLAAVTISHGATFSGLPSGRYVDLISGNATNCNGTLTASVSGQGNLAVYVLDNGVSGSLTKISA